MEKVTGRSDDMIIVRGINVFPTQIEAALLSRRWCAGHFVIEVTRRERLDEMTVITEARPDHWDGAGLRDESQRLADSIKNTIGVTCRVVIHAPGTIERSAGKAKRVIDRR